MVLIDESGVMLRPLVRRTLAPRGRTPILKHRAGHREKVSCMAALTLSPRRQRLGLYWQTLRNGSFDSTAVARFLRQLLRHLRGRVLVVWDRGSMHRGPAVRELLARQPRLSAEHLPAYAPELNPVEHLWTYLKWNRLCNWAPTDSVQLQDRAQKEIERIRRDTGRLRSFLKASKLTWPKRALAS